MLKVANFGAAHYNSALPDIVCDRTRLASEQACERRVRYVVIRDALLCYALQSIDLVAPLRAEQIPELVA